MLCRDEGQRSSWSPAASLPSHQCQSMLRTHSRPHPGERSTVLFHVLSGVPRKQRKWRLGEPSSHLLRRCGHDGAVGPPGPSLSRAKPMSVGGRAGRGSWDPQTPMQQLSPWLWHCRGPRQAREAWGALPGGTPVPCPVWGKQTLVAGLPPPRQQQLPLGFCRRTTTTEGKS